MAERLRYHFSLMTGNSAYTVAIIDSDVSERHGIWLTQSEGYSQIRVAHKINNAF